MVVPFLVIALAAASPRGASAPTPPSRLTCHEAAGPTAWRLDFDWPHEHAQVSRQAKGAWESLFRDAAAVHVFEGDGTLLIETSLKEWVGPGGEGPAACGHRIETLFFDLAPRSGRFEGTLEKTPRWQGRDDESCGPAPEEVSGNVRLSCDPS